MLSVGTALVLVSLDHLKGRYSSWCGVSSVPTILIVLVGATILSGALDLKQHGVQVIGFVQAGYDLS